MSENTHWGSSSSEALHACNCVGPQNGAPKCPCQMKGLVQQDGRWVQPQRDLGPVKVPGPAAVHGCICPVGAEKTCQGTLCPRRGLRRLEAS